MFSFATWRLCAKINIKRVPRPGTYFRQRDSGKGVKEKYRRLPWFWRWRRWAGTVEDNRSTLPLRGLRIKKARLHFCNRALLLLKNPAIPTFALVGTIIGSESLTTVFGMGTGGPFGYGHRERATGAVAHCDPVGL